MRIGEPLFKCFMVMKDVIEGKKIEYVCCVICRLQFEYKIRLFSYDYIDMLGNDKMNYEKDVHWMIGV